MEIGNLMVDYSAAVAGVWQDMGPFSMKLAFAALTNKDFQKTIQRLTEPHRRAIELNMMNGDTALEINYQAYASCIVKDWKGLERNGVEVPFSVAECVALFKGNPRIFEAVQKIASDDAAYRVKPAEGDVKNS